MKTAFYISSILLFSSPMALGATIALQCSNGQLSTNVTLESGETCTGTQIITLNGNTNQSNIDNNSIPIAPLTLEPTDAITASISINCEINGDPIVVSDSISNNQGCSTGGVTAGGEGGAGGDGGNGGFAGGDGGNGGFAGGDGGDGGNGGFAGGDGGNGGNGGFAGGAGGDGGGNNDAQTVRVILTNLTRGNYFTPLALAAHSRNFYLFRVGEEASEGLQAMAEGGDTGPLIEALPESVIQPTTPLSSGLLGPGETTDGQATLTLSNNGTYYLSVAGMILPTNDGFVGIDSLKIPSQRGVYTFLLNAYDAGSEGNDELNTGEGAGASGNPGFPVPPPLAPSVGEGGSGFELDPEGFVHVHRGVLGDTDPNGGISDIDSTVHRWLNPVARLIVTVE